MRLEKRAQRRVLPLSERRMLSRLINDPALDAETADVDAQGWVHAPFHGITRRSGDANTLRMKKALEEGSPADESAPYKRWRDRRIKVLEERLVGDTIPHREFYLKRADTRDYHKIRDGLVQQNQDGTRQAMTRELQSLLRERDPENPNAGKLSYLREPSEVKA